jgi:hypothetical protein
LPNHKERGFLTVCQQHLRPLDPTRCFASRARNRSQAFNLFVGHRQLDRLPPPPHVATPRWIKHKRGIHKRVAGSIAASFMESVV